MARLKIISDHEVLAVVVKLLLLQGEKSVTFAAVAQRCKLAPPTLVQRFGSSTAMLEAALTQAWDDLAAETERVFEQTASKGVQGSLKALAACGDSPALVAQSLKSPAMTARAKAWRDQVEARLAVKLGSGANAAETAAVTFAAWQGRLLWDGAGGKGFRFGEALKRLSD